MAPVKAAVLSLLLAYSVSLAQVSQGSDQLLNWCLDGANHKDKPGPESHLFQQCTPWKNRSCCKFETTQRLHEPRMYNFDYDHCSSVKSMSEDCRRHFIQDHCFYECSPNIGPWVVKVNMKYRQERYYQVPLCESDCEAWFSACQDDFTCTDNWMRNFIWEKGRNKCVPGTECHTFKQVYKTANNFCQRVWDDAWKVVNDSEACMRLWFDGSAGNPNDNVAKLRVGQMTALTSRASTSLSSAVCLSLLLLLAQLTHS